jgi:gluconolactonase
VENVSARWLSLAAVLVLVLPSFSVFGYETLFVPTEVRYNDPSRAFDGYTMFPSRGFTYLLDMEGRVVHTWNRGSNPKLLDNGNILDRGSYDILGGAGFQEVDWNSTVVWQYTETRRDYSPHHDFNRIFNTKLNAWTTIYIAQKNITSAQALAAGADPSTGPYNGAQMDVLVEVAMNGTVVWEWWFFDHVVQDIDPAKPNYVGDGKNISDYPGRININMPGRPLRADWLHCNALDYNQKLDQIVVSSLYGEFYVVDHGATFVANDPAASLALARGPKGDFLYRFGDPARYGRGVPPSILEDWTRSSTGTKQLGGAHDIQWIRDGLPGAGHFLLFNNAQYLYERTPQSYVVEINPYLDSDGRDTGHYVDPPSAGYRLVEPFDPKNTSKQARLISNQTVWMYGARSNQDLYDQIGCSVQRLGNGNTLICSCAHGRIIEATAKGDIVWEYVNPDSVLGLQKVRSDSLPMVSAMFRAYRIGPGHPALAGRTLTPGNPLTGPVLGPDFRPPEGATETFFLNASASCEGYTLFSAFGKAYLIDLEGRVVNSWSAGAVPRLLDNGTLLAAAYTDLEDLREIRMLGWDGSVLWKYQETRPGYLMHHDFLVGRNKELGADTLMYLASRPVTAREALAAGCDPADGPYDDARTDGVVEVDMNGTVAWEWWFFDHGIQDVDPSKANHVGAGRNISVYPGRINLNLPGRPVGKSWLSANSIDYNGKLDQLVVNSELGEFYIVDHGGTFAPGDPASSRLLAAGPAGDFLYRFGDPARYGQGAPPSVQADWTLSTTGNKQIGGSNAVHWIDAGLPGEGNLLVFNNGQYYFERSAQSYIFEVDPFRNSNGAHTTAYVDPPSAGYFRLGTPYSTLKAPKLISNQVLWNYYSRTNLGFFSHLGSNAQRLPNGNTMVCAMTEGHIFEITSNGAVVWEYISPLTAEGPRTSVHDCHPMTNAVYRALRYGPDAPALKGRNLSAGDTITGAAPHYMTQEMIDGVAGRPELYDVERTPFQPTPSESAAITARVDTTAALASMRLVYSVTRPGESSSEDMVFRETMAAEPSSVWTGAGADNPWNVVARSPADVAQAAKANFGEGARCGLAFSTGTGDLNDTMVTTVHGIDTRADTGHLDFNLRSEGLEGTDGWALLLDGGSGFATRMSELAGQNHGWRSYRLELGPGELSGPLSIRFQFRGGDAGDGVWLDQIYVNVSANGSEPAADTVLPMLDDGKHGDGPAGDGRFGAAIPAFPEATRINYYIAAVATGGAEAREPAGAPAVSRSYTVAKGAAAWTSGPLPDTGQTGDFTSVFGEDSDFTANAPSFSDNGDGTVTDTATGLLWQKSDGGAMDWEQAWAYAGALELGGYDDWRLPSSHELFDLLDFQKAGRALDADYFPDTGAQYYWSADFLAGDAGRAWAVNAGGTIDAYAKNDTSGGAAGRFVARCVRDGNARTAPSGAFTDNGDGTVDTASTGLVWQKAEAPAKMSWEEALAYCGALSLGGRDDWRLPNIKELRSLTNDTLRAPSASTAAFPGALGEGYWSSTSAAGVPSQAWRVDFARGQAGTESKASMLQVRAVRGGLPAAGEESLPELVAIPGGTFVMGDHSGLGSTGPGNTSDELPLHDVTVGNFSIGRFEVTNSRYCDFLQGELARGAVAVAAGGVYELAGPVLLCDLHSDAGASSISWDGRRFSVANGKMNQPATGIRWEGAAAYCNWLGAKNGLAPVYDLRTGEWNRTAAGYRLPTEAEWEWAALGARNDSYPIFPWGDDAEASRANWPDSNDPYEAGPAPWTTPAGFYDGSVRRKADFGWPGRETTYKTADGSNALGIHDLAGNAWEWVNDLYDSGYYSLSAHVNPSGPENGTVMPDGKTYHSLRGGSWLDGLFGQSRISDRSSGYIGNMSGGSYANVGFRIVLAPAREPSGLAAPGARLERLAGGLSSADGPAADAAGNLYFADPVGSRIYEWSVDGALSIFQNDTGGATGLCFESNGDLAVCEAANRRVTSIDMADPSGAAAVLADVFGGKAFNGPDDLWVDPKGGIYFTDTQHGNAAPAQDRECVYHLAPGASGPVRVVDDLARPGGLAGSADGRTLYISDAGAGRTYRYAILPNGSLTQKELFVEFGAGGITLDKQGNVILAERSVLVFDRSGRLLAEWAVPERPTNLEFGGSGRRTLFITTEKGLFGIRLETEGASNFVPRLFINEMKLDNETDGNGTVRQVFWVELYNNGTGPVDIGGLYMTNDLDNPAAWRIPDDTTIPAKGFLVIWADGALVTGPLHAPFALDAAGGEVAVFMPNGLTLVDRLAFGPQAANASFGRYPDGSDNLTLMHDHPSPGAPNVPDDPDDGGQPEPPVAKPRTITVDRPGWAYLVLAAAAVAVAVAAGLYVANRRRGRREHGGGG